MRKKLVNKILSILLLTSLIMTQMSDNVVFAEEAKEETAEDKEVVVIENVEELLAFAEKCDTDVWSADKLVELQADISLAGVDFEPIAVFAGTFNGNGHAITDLHYVGSGYADGFFRYITPTGIVQNLTISGWVEAENEKKCTGGFCGINGGWILECTFSGSVQGKSETGGIAGENESTGTISSCSVVGSVTGYDRAGGIAGSNYGTIRNCTNKAGINSDSSWLEEEDEAGLEWLLEDISERKLISGTDIGGIAGYSKGLLMNCNNEGIVGYEHNGYNIGGIVGRQSGQVMFCHNNGSVYGRKDVGGIVGQMEPYISVEEAESLSEAVQRLHDLVDIFLDDAGNTQDKMSEDFDILRSHSDEALQNADSIADRTTDFIDENISAVNETADRMRYCMEQVPFIAADVSSAIDSMSRTTDALGRLADALDMNGKAGNTVYDETAHARLSLVSGVGGELYADSALPAEGDVVTLTVSPMDGYKLSYISVSDAAKKTVDLSMRSDTEYTFVMPADNVVVKAEFVYDGSAVSDAGDGRVTVMVSPAGSRDGGSGSQTGSTDSERTDNLPDSVDGATGTVDSGAENDVPSGDGSADTPAGGISGDVTDDAEISAPGEEADDETETPAPGEEADDETGTSVPDEEPVYSTDDKKPEGDSEATDDTDAARNIVSADGGNIDTNLRFRKLVNTAGVPGSGSSGTEHTIAVRKNGTDEGTFTAYAGDIVVVNAQPDNGCRTSIQITANG